MPSKKSSNNNQNIIWIVIAVILLIAIGVTLYFVLRHKKESYIPPHSEENYEEATKLHEHVIHQIANKIAKEKAETQEKIQKAADYIQQHVGMAIETASKFLTSVTQILAEHKVTQVPIIGNDKPEHHITKSPQEKQKEILEHIRQVAKTLKLSEHFNTKDILENLDNIKKFTNKVHQAFEVHGKKGDFISLGHSLHDDFTEELKVKIDETGQQLNKINETQEKIKKQEAEISTGAPHEVLVLKKVLAKKEENSKNFLEKLKELSKKDVSKDELKKLVEEAAKKDLEAPKHVAKQISEHLAKQNNLENYVNGVSSLEDFLPEFFIENYGFFDSLTNFGKKAIEKVSNVVDSVKDGMSGEAVSWIIDHSGLIDFINSKSSGFAEIVNDVEKGLRVLKIYSEKFKTWFMNKVRELGANLSGVIKTGFNALVTLAETQWTKVFGFFIDKLKTIKDKFPGINDIVGVFSREDYEGPAEKEHKRKQKELDTKCIATHIKKMIKKCYKEAKSEETKEKEKYEKENYEEDEDEKTKPPSKEERERGNKFITSLENVIGKEKIENLRKKLGHYINNKHVLNIIVEIADDKKLVDAVRFIHEHQEAENKRKLETKKPEGYYYYSY